MAGLEPQQLCSALEKNRIGEMEKKGVDALLGGSGREGAATGIKQRSCMLCLDWWHWRLDRRREVEERTSLPDPTRTASCTTPLSRRLPTPLCWSCHVRTLAPRHLYIPGAPGVAEPCHGGARRSRTRGEGLAEADLVGGIHGRRGSWI
ncbi:hypothetical protein GQ55_6G075100 [Panicum hallii var. hallii]|uniref:Uncharacterized protein n=1 Tax=Panicum hallii var. hallii TaxID=1504633 RepID=A0A2T7D4Y4_9POAL|nr:hypothetical protein GQ55_6G075100 [Panicum hallii var. hallii]